MPENSLAQLKESAQAASGLLRSMSNPSRLLILCMLIDSPGTSAGELSRVVGLSPSATSQHLARMKAENLIECKRLAQRMNYFIKDESVRKLVTILKEIYCPEVGQ
ncbi:MULTISPECIES: metalloregulator ArsR/SmtB family transcription factor [Pectobacteriaceae]|uniref:Helix-turn-helix transcriptional regulator n=1 Tax=Affinibrenneria salicis TaxID=2590031 RepID=A0A5J5FTF3_9GAMM|nr:MULTISPECIES: metalloregulator ArsR/SmtB family transcription factor [Pectobacteriaceae]MEE3644433.1 metalloregulator ArsR/SmtB family transcription factor [Brenneria sp. L3_3C_1]MEE3663659.1 metalloregulator ArsR/SmtB family transcription factor [Brenneria sp. g21c3]KAA8995883.1 helix-turn-helix transcriptional regulator [Affinibrenneria salicis]MBJ7223191.1 helix-turn-helix transcriptional regulator [Brenneria sp. L3-3C-1]MDX5628597.1 metalloregulator ArsR/SmtB family transcription factor